MKPAKDKLTRRQVLRLALERAGKTRSVGITAAGKQASLATSLPRSPSVKTWITDTNRRVIAGPKIDWTVTEKHSGSNEILLEPNNKHQEILGFGAAFTDAACYLFNQLKNECCAELFRKLFSPSEMNLNVCRICIGSSDCSTSIYNYDPGSVDPDLANFSIAHDRAYILPILRRARAINPDLFLFASPWSPPGWMKSNNSMLGGCMRHTYMASYANYFLKFLKAYEAEGVPVHAVTVQNEVDADQDGTMPACAWPQDYEADFVTMHLGPLFQRAMPATKIWLIDHNYDLWGRAICELETPEVRKYTNSIAWHGYVGEPEWMIRVQNAFPDVEMFWTEGGPNYTAPDYQTDWAKWGEKFSRILRCGCRSLTVWNFISDEHGRPYVGAGTLGVGGAMVLCWILKAM